MQKFNTANYTNNNWCKYIRLEKLSTPFDQANINLEP